MKQVIAETNGLEKAVELIRTGLQPRLVHYQSESWNSAIRN
jgi:hypothetical protein